MRSKGGKEKKEATDNDGCEMDIERSLHRRVLLQDFPEVLLKVYTS